MKIAKVLGVLMVVGWGLGLAGCTTTEKYSQELEALPAGRAFVYPVTDKKVGPVEIWGVDGQRVELVKLKDVGVGAIMKAGQHKIRVRLERPIWVQGEMLTQLSLPAYFYGDNIYSANLLPSAKPRQGQPPYQYWLANMTESNIVAEGVYFRPPE